jgi:hypothetical protein
MSDNAIRARLQKKVVITESVRHRYCARQLRSDRQWFQVPPSGTLEGTMVVYAEDGVTPLGSSLVNISAGKAMRSSCTDARALQITRSAALMLAACLGDAVNSLPQIVRCNGF